MLDWVFCACSIGWLGVLWDSTAWQKIPCYPNVLKSTMPKSMNFLELLCTWCNPGLSREALQVELEVSGRGEHGLGGASIPQVGWLCVVFVCMHMCVCSTCCVCGGQRTTVATSWKLCEFRILNSARSLTHWSILLAPFFTLIVSPKATRKSRDYHPTLNPSICVVMFHKGGDRSQVYHLLFNSSTVVLAPAQHWAFSLGTPFPHWISRYIVSRNCRPDHMSTHDPEVAP